MCWNYIRNFIQKILGTNVKIVSVLDGDMQDKLNKAQKNLPHLFLPILSVEKFLYSVIKENTNPILRRIINDKYFIVSSLSDIVAEYNKGTLEGATDNIKIFMGY